MVSVDWRGLILPFSYVAVLLGTFITFSRVYRKRKAVQKANLKPWFGPHLQRNIYLSLLHMEPEPGHDKAPQVPQSVLRASLLRRAVEDIHRVIQIRTAKAACSTLLQRGSVGDDLWQRFLRAENEMNMELRDVVQEANALAPNWGQAIFATANEIFTNTMLRKQIEEVQSKTPAEKEWWEKRRAAISSEFMKELDQDAEKSQNKANSEDGVLIDSPTAERPASSGRPSTAGSGAGGKKKKGRK